MPELVAESFAPWSEKARWALDHHRINYAYREYRPVVDEPWLRWRTGAWFGRVSTPTLIADGGVYGDSFAIAQWAERHGSGAPLFPGDCLAGIATWNSTSERALAAGRVRVVARMAEVPGAKSEMLPPGIPAALHPVLGVAADATFAYLRWKYGFGTDVEAGTLTLRTALEDLRAALGGRDHVYAELTYADLAMAVVLQMVRPVPDRWIRLGPAAREVWTDETLATDFADLVDWRDRLYAAHR